MKYTYIANWKMNLSFNESINFCKNNKEKLEQLISDQTSIILCPSFVALAPIVEIFKHSAIAIGAQNCSEHKAGSFTGEVSAQSLAEIGTKYCIVGHSEQRMYFGETTEAIVKKISLLFDCNIQPIVCIGETKKHFLNKATLTVLTEQLRPILESMTPEKNTHLMIAYEPVWAIGSDIIPENTYLQEVFEWLAALVQSHAPSHITTQLLYGGSVNSKNINQLKNISLINGFLVGGASTNFDTLKNIIAQ